MSTSVKVLIAALVLAIVANAGSFWIGYEKGKTKGYSLASKDRATQTYAAREQSVENNFNYGYTKTFALLSWGRFHLLCFDRPSDKPQVTQQILKEQAPFEVNK